MVHKSYEKAQNWDITEADLSKTIIERSKGKKDRLLQGTKKELLDLYKKNNLPEELSPYVGEKIHKDGNKLILVVAPYFQVDDSCLTIKESDLIDNVDRYYNEGNGRYQKLFEQRNALISEARDYVNSVFNEAKEFLEKDISNKESFDFNIDFEHTIFHWFLPRPLKMTPDEFFFTQEFIKPKGMATDLFKKQIAIITYYDCELKKVITDAIQDPNHVYTSDELWNITDDVTELTIKIASKLNEPDSQYSFEDLEQAKKLGIKRSLIQDRILGYETLKKVIDISHPDIILFIGKKTRLLVNAASFNYKTYEEFLKTYRYKKDRFQKFEKYLSKNDPFAEIGKAILSGDISTEQKEKIKSVFLEMLSRALLDRKKQKSPFRTLLENFSIQESSIRHHSEPNPLGVSHEKELKFFARQLYAENRIQGLDGAIRSLNHSEDVQKFINDKMIKVAFPAIEIIEQTRSRISSKDQASKAFVSAVDDLVKFLKELPEYTEQMYSHNLRAKKLLQQMFELGDDKEIKKAPRGG